jgi:hypothetical protein
MEFTLPLEQMSTEEKIRTMETIWDDLCKKAVRVILVLFEGNYEIEKNRYVTSHKKARSIF